MDPWWKTQIVIDVFSRLLIRLLKTQNAGFKMTVNIAIYQSIYIEVMIMIFSIALWNNSF